uniref:Putative polysaccharide-binding protein n=1 Tax=Porphyra purpurea TaxID=2787 RepID=PSBP_PORPU|nr:RecName: Full=Putative polysaccharide-binding protein; Flags: Precursor [Porphyra purpurea]AAA61792.1 Putative polysaccharide binding protein; This protein contains a signal peptide and four domains similar to cellulose-binding domains of fungal cellulases; A proline/serine/threonine rich linker region connects domains II and III [Porphyra purpurea]
MGFLKGTAAALTLLSAAAAASACGVLYEQCGGIGFDGVTCCSEGLMCMKMGPYYSQCRAMPGMMGQVKPYGQCGGMNYSGKTMCSPGFKCVELNEFFSQCDLANKSPVATPKVSPTSPPGPAQVCGKEYAACGGEMFMGAKCCKFGLVCYETSGKWQSQCRAPPPKMGEVGRYAQCGGMGYMGSTMCVGGYKCMAISEGSMYKQCLPMHP